MKPLFVFPSIKGWARTCTCRFRGDQRGRFIAEFYFIYQDNHIKYGYSRTPKERYDAIDEVFPDIHNRAPQHMIAS